MSNTRWWVAMVASTLLVGCGDSDDDKGPSLSTARSEAVIDSAETAAKLAGYLNVIDALDESADVRGLEQGFRSKAARQVLKFRLEDNCPDGGSFAIFDDNQPEQLTMQFSSCREGFETLNGQVFLQCQAGSFQDDSCSNTLINFGSGGSRFSFSDAQQSVNLNGSWRLIESSTGLRVEQTLEVTGANLQSDVRVAAVTSNFFQDLEQDGNGGALAVVGGSVGAALSGSNVDCATGLVTFTTREQLQINADGSLSGGRVLISNQSGDSAELAISADGSLTVSYQGSTQSFSRSEYQGFCSLD